MNKHTVQPERRPLRVKELRSPSPSVGLLPSMAAVLCWAGALALLLLANLRAEAGFFAPQRLLFYALVLAAGLLTFLPIQTRMKLPGLALVGVSGTALLLYILAIVPPPTDWLFSLPDTPVYMLLFLGLFCTTSAVVLPFVYALGQRLFAQRVRQFDRQRAWRQVCLVGTFVTCMAALASLRVLTWVSLLLLTLILVVAELLFLSRVEASEH